MRFSQAQHAISDVFFLKTGVFSMRLFLICFHRSTPSIFTRNEAFCEHKGLLKVFGIMPLTGDLRRKKFLKFFFLKFLYFWKVFGWGSWILLFPVGEEWFSRFMRIPSGIFWRCKTDEILIMSFYPWFSVWYCLPYYFEYMPRLVSFFCSDFAAYIRRNTVSYSF